MKWNKKGFTMVEAITTVTLLLIVIAPVTMMFNMWYENFHKDNSEVFLQQKARDIMGMIIQDLRRCSNIDTTCTNENKTIYINDSLVYTYNDENNILLKNQIDVINDENIQMNEFHAIENGSIITINFKLISNNDVEIDISTVFRKRVEG